MRIMTPLFLVLTVLMTALSVSAVDIKKTQVLHMPEKQENVLMTEEFTNRILPQKINPDEPSSKLLSKMADNSISYYWETSPLRYSSAGQAVETVDKKVNVEANFKDDNNVDHKVSFKVLAIQALAKIEYKGWVNAFVNYDIKRAKAEAELVEALSSQNDLVLSHAVTHSETNSALSLRWKW